MFFKCYSGVKFIMFVYLMCGLLKSPLDDGAIVVVVVVVAAGSDDDDDVVDYHTMS